MVQDMISLDPATEILSPVDAELKLREALILDDRQVAKAAADEIVVSLLRWAGYVKAADLFERIG